MHPVRLSKAEQAAITRWSIRTGSVFALLPVVLIGAAVLAPAPQRPGATFEVASADPRTCASWDAAAREAFATLVHEPGDAALRQVGDMVFRLRRARRNCEHGWLNLACQDYQAIAIRKETDLVSSPACPPALQTDASAKAE